MEIKTKETKNAGGVVLNKQGEVLVVSQQGVSWSLPKGYIEDGEEVLYAAKREIYEESGISPDQLEFVKNLGTYTRYRGGKNGGDDLSEIKEITIFLFRTNTSDLKPIDPDNPEARWIPREEVADLLTHRKDKEFFVGVVNNL